MYPWANAFSTEHGFSHLLLPAFISKSLQNWHWIGTILTSLLCQPSLHSHHNSLAQICDNYSLPLSLDFSSVPLVFHFSSRQSDSLQWPSLATDVKTSWCCICKFLRWTVSYTQTSSPWAFQSSLAHDNKDVSEWFVKSQLLFKPTPDNSSSFLSKNVRDTIYPDNLSKFFILLIKWILHSYLQQNGPRKATPPRNIQKSSITIIPSCSLLTNYNLFIRASLKISSKKQT